MVVLLVAGIGLIAYMALGHPEVWDQSASAKAFAVWFLYPWLFLIGYAVGRHRRRRKRVEYIAQCGLCGESVYIPQEMPMKDREQFAILWARDHNQSKHKGDKGVP